MNGSANSSLNEKSEALSGTSSSVPEENKWRSSDPNRVQTGTACTCGAHTNLFWGEGGKAWLEAHVAEVHAEAFDWAAAIRKALAMPSGAREYLTSLVEKHDA